MTKDKLHIALDRILDVYVRRQGGIPGVVAMATDQNSNFYEGAAGRRALDSDQPMTLDSMFPFFSSMKPMTGVVAWQLIEEGLLSLDDPAGDYLPDLDALEVLVRFDDDGKPVTRKPKRRITVRDLMLHTSGHGYEFFFEGDLQYRAANNIPSIVGSSSYEAIPSVLMHDPGERWSYGPNIDWVGLIVEKLRGKRLAEVLRERLFEPLEMQDVGFYLNEDMTSRQVGVHMRTPQGTINTMPDLAPHQTPEMDCGGHGLYGSVGEFMKFIRMVLSDGMGPYGPVLNPETVRAMAQDGLAELGLSVTGWTGTMPGITGDDEFLPGINKGWSYTFMVNREEASTGRSAGSLAWAGLANTFFWIDRAKGIGGYWATGMLPFLDAVAYPGSLEFESAVYRFR